MILTEKEYVALDKVAMASKMDCWFSIRQEDENDYVFDLENGCRMELKEGVAQLAEGMCDFHLYGLTEEEKSALRNLFRKLNIEEVEGL